MEFNKGKFCSPVYVDEQIESSLARLDCGENGYENSRGVVLEFFRWGLSPFTSGKHEMA